MKVLAQIRRWFSAVVNELQLVIWPTFKKVVRQTGIVVAVAVLGAALIYVFDTSVGVVARRLYQ